MNERMKVDKQVLLLNYVFQNSHFPLLLALRTMSLRLIVALTLVGAATAWCPNGCSGHGMCGTSTTLPKDTCVCFTRLETECK